MSAGLLGKIIFNVFSKVKTSSGFAPISKNDTEVTFARTLNNHIKFDGKEYYKAEFKEEMPRYMKKALDWMVEGEKAPNNKKGDIDILR